MKKNGDILNFLMKETFNCSGSFTVFSEKQKIHWHYKKTDLCNFAS